MAKLLKLVPKFLHFVSRPPGYSTISLSLQRISGSTLQAAQTTIVIPSILTTMANPVISS